MFDVKVRCRSGSVRRDDLVLKAMLMCSEAVGCVCAR